MVETLRKLELPTAPAGREMLPITKLEFPVTVIMLFPEKEEVVLKRQVDESDDASAQVRLPLLIGIGESDCWRFTVT